jgi:molybdopterin synthase sulfur carrier subunit
MNRKIVCFAGLKKFFGDETNIEVAPEESYASCRIAVNEKFVPLDETVKDQTTLFLIPPSSGG